MSIYTQIKLIERTYMLRLLIKVKFLLVIWFYMNAKLIFGINKTVQQIT